MIHSTRNSSIDKALPFSYSLRWLAMRQAWFQLLHKGSLCTTLEVWLGLSNLLSIAALALVYGTVFKVRILILCCLWVLAGCLEWY